MSEKYPDRDISDSQTSPIVYEVHLMVLKLIKLVHNIEAFKKQVILEISKRPLQLSASI